nr:MAG TPA: hypothetical protein [Bacteriophage sp.]
MLILLISSCNVSKTSFNILSPCFIFVLDPSTPIVFPNFFKIFLVLFQIRMSPDNLSVVPVVSLVSSTTLVVLVLSVSHSFIIASTGIVTVWDSPVDNLNTITIYLLAESYVAEETIDENPRAC